MDRVGRSVLIAALALLAAPRVTASKPVLGLNVFFASDFKDAAYQREAFDKVLKAWTPAAPLPPPGKKAVVISTVGRDGKLLDAYFNAMTGNRPFDQEALRAVKSAAPFPPLPKLFPRDTVEVHWHFEVGK